MHHNKAGRVGCCAAVIIAAVTASRLQLDLLHGEEVRNSWDNVTLITAGQLMFSY